MATSSIEVRSVVFGEPDPFPSLEGVRLELMSERLTVRELIRRAVKEQVRDLLEKRKLETDTARLALNRQYLTQKEVDVQAESGRTRILSEKEVLPTGLEAETEVKKAFRGFRDKAYQVMVDGKLVEELDDEIVVTPDTRITFMRLIPLVVA